MILVSNAISYYNDIKRIFSATISISENTNPNLNIIKHGFFNNFMIPIPP